MTRQGNSGEMLGKDASIYVAGHTGMVGSAIVRMLEARGYTRILTRTRAELDLRDTRTVNAFMADAKPEFVFIAAARVGGIHANNTYRAEFLYENLMIEANLIHAAHLSGVGRLMFLGSSCIYPREAPQPIREDSLLTGPLEYTNEPYAIAKIAGLKLCENYSLQYGREYFTVMPTNVYGTNDNYDPQTSHVMAALIRKAHEAKESGATEMTVWGTGRPLREFIHADDLADACVFLMEIGYCGAPINIGVGYDVTIGELAETVKDVVGFEGNLVFDASKPDGTPRKLMDSSRLAALGWTARIPIRDGIDLAYRASPFYPG
jgi:GDP-L-fucose synthase